MQGNPSKPCPGKGVKTGRCPNKRVNGQGYCPECQKLVDKAYDRHRGSSASRGYDANWQKVRDAKANRNPLCEECLLTGIERPLDVVHHIKPVDKFPELRLVMENLKSLCTPHHEAIHGPERWASKNR